MDLSGPSNTKDTVFVCFQKQNETLHYVEQRTPLSDLECITFVEALANKSEVIIGIDAPLSYEDGGGDRKRDRELRQYIKELGMKSGSIMTPTMTRMVYLSLRGIRLTRELERLETEYNLHIVEVHPGAAIGARMEGRIKDMLEYKKDECLREKLCGWFESQQLFGIPDTFSKHTHPIDACAAALAAWHWHDPACEPPWVHKASLPLHPYDFCC